MLATEIMGKPEDFDFNALPEDEMNAIEAAFSEDVKSVHRDAFANALAEGATPEEADSSAADIRGQYVQLRLNDNDRARAIWAYYVIAMKRGATPEAANGWTAAFEESCRLEDKAVAEERRRRNAEFTDGDLSNF